MFRYFFLGFAIVTFLSSVCQPLRLAFQRGDYDTGNIISLSCFNDQDIGINLRTNNNIKFFVNRTVSPDEESLDEMVQLILSDAGTSASFTITGELEGHYVCGMIAAPHTNSDPVSLVVLPTNDGFLEGREIYAIRGREARIPCSFQPGMLQACYFGEWFKDSTRIFSISKPSSTAGVICGSISPGRQVMNINPNKYLVNEETFELTILSVTAEDDSGPYRCRLYVLNPASMGGQTSQFRSMPVNLTVDGQPNILEAGAPTDVIVGLEPDQERLTETATFECEALGRPTPIINWYYIIVNQDGTMGTKKQIFNDNKFNVTNSSSSEDQTRRFKRTSLLMMSVTENDGGIIRCQTGAFFKDAYLTVLSKPSINIITSLRGEIIYMIRLPVHLNRPVKLNFTYQDAENERLYSRDSQPVESYNDTNEITYREDREQVPGECSKCHVIVTLTGQMGSQAKHGLSVTSADVIDVEARTPQETIDHLNSTVIITGTVLASVIVIIFLVIIIAVVSCYLIRARLKQKHWKINRDKNKKMVLKDVEGIKENMTDLGNNMNNEEFRKDMVSRIKKKLEKLEEFITTDFDDISSDAPQVDLEEVDKCLENILSKYETQ